MKSENAIEVKDLTKKFKVYYDKGNQLKERLLFRSRNRYEERWVLNGISFEVKKGEAIGLIGHNGCGKSTTLKLLSRIIYPDSGTIEMRGRVSSLIELGAGFHPDMSGRENIYINAAIFGLTKKEIDARVDDIIAFSELEEFIDNPVRTYSSGMYMRLAFSVAINVDADILLIDEILAVGDANFQEKCFNKLREIKASGVTVVLVTHDLNAIERFCNQAIWINNGEVVVFGQPTEVVEEYLRYMNKEKLIHMDKEEQKIYGKIIDTDEKHFGTGAAIIKRAVLLNAHKEETQILKAGEDYYILFEYYVKTDVKELVFGMGFYTLENVWIFGTNTLLGKVKVPIKQSEGKIEFHGMNMNLLSGEYILQVSITDIDGRPVDFYREYSRFHVVSDKRDSGLVYFQNKWEM